MLPVSCCSSCSPRCRVRGKPNVDSDQIDNDGALSLRRVQSHLSLDRLLGYRLLRSLGATQRHRRWTTAVVPSYLVSDFAVPLVEDVQWRPIRNRLDTHSS